MEKALDFGVKKEQIILDPGFGFGKSVKDNFALVKHIETFKKLGFPIYIGLSRKSSLAKVCDIIDPTKRDNASTSLHTIALLNGADYLRVHNVSLAVEAKKIVNFFAKA